MPLQLPAIDIRMLLLVAALCIVISDADDSSTIRHCLKFAGRSNVRTREIACRLQDRCGGPRFTVQAEFEYSKPCLPGAASQQACVPLPAGIPSCFMWQRVLDPTPLPCPQFCDSGGAASWQLPEPHVNDLPLGPRAATPAGGLRTGSLMQRLVHAAAESAQAASSEYGDRQAGGAGGATTRRRAQQTLTPSPAISASPTSGSPPSQPRVIVLDAGNAVDASAVAEQGPLDINFDIEIQPMSSQQAADLVSSQVLSAPDQAGTPDMRPAPSPSDTVVAAITFPPVTYEVFDARVAWVMPTVVVLWTSLAGLMAWLAYIKRRDPYVHIAFLQDPADSAVAADQATSGTAGVNEALPATPAGKPDEATTGPDGKSGATATGDEVLSFMPSQHQLLSGVEGVDAAGHVSLRAPDPLLPLPQVNLGDRAVEGHMPDSQSGAAHVEYGTAWLRDGGSRCSTSSKRQPPSRSSSRFSLLRLGSPQVAPEPSTGNVLSGKQQSNSSMSSGGHSQVVVPSEDGSSAVSKASRAQSAAGDQEGRSRLRPGSSQGSSRLLVRGRTQEAGSTRVDVVLLAATPPGVPCDDDGDDGDVVQLLQPPHQPDDTDLSAALPAPPPPPTSGRPRPATVGGVTRRMLPGAPRTMPAAGPAARVRHLQQVPSQEGAVQPAQGIGGLHRQLEFSGSSNGAASSSHPTALLPGGQEEVLSSAWPSLSRPAPSNAPSQRQPPELPGKDSPRVDESGRAVKTGGSAPVAARVISAPDDTQLLPPPMLGFTGAETGSSGRDMRSATHHAAGATSQAGFEGVQEARSRPALTAGVSSKSGAPAEHTPGPASLETQTSAKKGPAWM